MLNFERLYSILESTKNNDLINVPYIRGDQYTHGRHSFGDEPEEPATDPAKIIKPEFTYKQKDIIEILEQNNASIHSVLFERYEWGSYHERSLTCYAHLLIKEPDVYDDLEKLHQDLEDHRNDDVDFFHSFSEYEKNKNNYISKTMEFTNLDNVLIQWKELVKTSNIEIPKTSSDEYWDKKIRNTMIKYKHDRGMYSGD